MRARYLAGVRADRCKRCGNEIMEGNAHLWVCDECSEQKEKYRPTPAQIAAECILIRAERKILAESDTMKRTCYKDRPVRVYKCPRY